MDKLGLISEKEAILGLLVKTHNELRTLEIVDRVMKRKDFKNDMGANERQVMGQNQERIRLSKETLLNLLDFLKEAKDEPELAKELKAYYPKE